MAARGEAQADVEVSTLVVPAWRLRWRAPELALVLGERAVALASTRRDEVDRLRAEALVVFASNRMGRGVRIADRALDALKAAEAASERETAWRLRVELADCARSVGAPLTGFAAVRPVLEADDVPPGLRATALVQAGECLVSVGRGAALAQALDEADHLYQADPLLDHDTTLLHRGLLRASAAGQHRRWGDLPAAVAAARDGLAVLDRLKEPSTDNGQVRGRLTVELVCALMDLDKLGEASEIGTPLLERPVRAPSASTAGWLRLALATRVHLPAGRVDQARDLLRDAADSAERHQLDTLLAESLLALAHVHEVAGDLAEALANLRSAHAAERRRARAVYAVRARLAAEFAGIHRRPAGGLHDELAALLRTGTPTPATDPNLAPEVKQQLRQWRPVQMHRNEGVRVKRSRRAAEDMTVDGISAARAHAADRWRLVQPFGETEGDQQPGDQQPGGQQPGGRRRAPDREPRPTQGRPEHARSGQARPTTGAPSGTRTSPASPTQPTPPTATPARPAAATPAGTEPTGGSDGATTSADTPAVGSATAGAGVGVVSAAGHAADGSDDATTPAAAHVGGSGPAAAGSSAAEAGVASAGSHAAGGSGDAVTPAGTHVGGSGPVAAGVGGSEDAMTPAGTRAGGFGEVAAVPSDGVPGAGPAHVSGAGPVVDASGGAGAEVGSGGVSAAGGSGGDPSGDARGVAEVPAAGGVGLADAGSAGARQDASVTSGIEAGSVAEGPAASAGQAGAEAGGHRESTGPAGAVPTAEAGGPVGGGSGEADAPAATEGGERSVPAAGLIAAAGAVRSGRRRAREASEEQGERAAGESDSSVLDTLKAAGLLDPQRAGGRRRARDADEAEAPESTPRAEGEPVQWRVEPPARLRSEDPPVVDMFDSPTMVQPAIRDDVPPVGLGAAFVKGPLIPTARVPDPPDYPPPPVPDFGIPGQSGFQAERTTPEPEAADVEARPAFPASDVDSTPEEQVEPLPEPDQVPGFPEPDQVPPVPVPEPVPADPSPEPAPPPARFGPTGFLSAADVEHDDTPTTTSPKPAPAPTPEPEAPSGEVPKEPFVTAVVVGGKTIDLPAIVEPPPPSGDSPSATRASRRHKSDLSLAELLAEALVAYEDARREDEAAGRVDVDEDTVPIPPVGTPPPVPDTETTAPIQRVDPPRRFDTWTLPEA
ncbi:hypothetical protein FHX81_2991 [Saccharothrix saharensis]|uniref:Uncharacterized protein n=1 Tax=Saccharothrix saharensis TaxID=571190 RepID=A0A543JCW2_9PSEU|nr:hypothetical protein [Saccharothrix saharensis]TQM80650.1 hypothetical protein FHX81_2991 [Saccharothrix saharensis]